MQDSKLGQRIAQRYAEALIALGTQDQLLDRFDADILLIETALKDQPDLQGFLASPLIKREIKKAVLIKAFASSLHPLTTNFLGLLVDRRRIVALEQICQTFRRILRELRKVVLVDVVSAVPLSSEQIEQLKTRLTILTKAQQIELSCRQDPELLGGMIVRFGDQVIDASLRGQLRRMALQLAAY